MNKTEEQALKYLKENKKDFLEPLANSNHCKQLISSHSNF